MAQNREVAALARFALVVLLLVPAATAQPRTDAERERFLAEAKVVAKRPTPGGITDSQRLILRLGGFEHEAHWQTVGNLGGPEADELGIEDSWRYNVAAYRLARLLGLDNVPVSIGRTIDGERGSLTWWVDDVRMSEANRILNRIRPPDVAAWNRRMRVVRVFDALIFNPDRNAGNLLIDERWRLWMIDHSMAFRPNLQPADMRPVEGCPPELLEAMRGLDAAKLRRAVRGLLTTAQLDGLLSRRDAIVRYLESRR